MKDSDKFQEIPENSYTPSMGRSARVRMMVWAFLEHFSIVEETAQLDLIRNVSVEDSNLGSYAG